MTTEPNALQMAFRLSALKRQAHTSNMWPVGPTSAIKPPQKLELKPFDFPPLPRTPSSSSKPPSRKKLKELCETNPEPLAVRAAKAALRAAQLETGAKPEPVSEITSNMIAAADDIYRLSTPPPRKSSGTLTGPSTRRLRATLSASRKGSDDRQYVKRLFDDPPSEEKSDPSEENEGSIDLGDHELQRITSNDDVEAQAEPVTTEGLDDDGKLGENSTEKGLPEEKALDENPTSIQQATSSQEKPEARPEKKRHGRRRMGTNSSAEKDRVSQGSEKTEAALKTSEGTVTQSPPRRTRSATARLSQLDSKPKGEELEDIPGAVTTPVKDEDAEMKPKSRGSKKRKAPRATKVKVEEESGVETRESKRKRRRSGLQNELFRLQKGIAAAPWTDSKKVESQTDIIVISDDESPATLRRPSSNRSKKGKQ